MPPPPKFTLKNGNAQKMAEEIFGAGVEVTGASYTGWPPASAIWSGGDTLGSAALPGDSGVILSTGRADDIVNARGPANASDHTTTNTPGVDRDPGFDALAGAKTHDAAWLDVSFVPDGDVMTMRFVFASEEFPEFSRSGFNDMVGVWINGEPVPVAAGDGTVAVTNINQAQNATLYLDNATGAHGVEMDGFTLSLSLTVPVRSGEENDIRIGIADVSDTFYDSNLLIAGGSAQTMLVASADRLDLDPNETATLDILGNDVNQTGGTLVVTHINGVAVSAGDSVTLKSGQVLTIKADGTLGIEGDADTETAHFTYEVAALGKKGETLETDIGMVTLNQLGFVADTLDQAPCFVAGTLIRTPVGERPVEALEAGDLVFTADGGAQPLRWVGRRTVPATGAHAPIHIDALTFGPHWALSVSPLHRILIRDALAELMFGETEVLIAARDLVNDRSVRPRPGGEVTYVHLLFDRHQLVWSNGLLTESFHPGPCTASAFEAGMVAEITGLFPELDLATGRGYGPTARRALRRFEATALARGTAG